MKMYQIEASFDNSGDVVLRQDIGNGSKAEIKLDICQVEVIAAWLNSLAESVSGGD